MKKDFEHVSSERGSIRNQDIPDYLSAFSHSETEMHSSCSCVAAKYVLRAGGSKYD